VLKRFLQTYTPRYGLVTPRGVSTRPLHKVPGRTPIEPESVAARLQYDPSFALVTPRYVCSGWAVMLPCVMTSGDM